MIKKKKQNFMKKNQKNCIFNWRCESNLHKLRELREFFLISHVFAYPKGRNIY